MRSRIEVVVSLAEVEGRMHFGETKSYQLMSSSGTRAIRPGHAEGRVAGSMRPGERLP
jgi:hypothetical protein